MTDPSAQADQALDITGDADFIYVVGYDTTGPAVGVGAVQQWRLEKRYKSSGSF
jgi:hypothetical protein